MPAIEHVALKLGDDECEARDFRRKIAQLNAAKVRLWNFGVPIHFAAPLVDLGLNLTHFLVSDDEKIARATGRIEYANSCHAVTQVQEHSVIVASLLKLRAQVVEKQGIEHFQDVGHARVVHAELTALLVLSDVLDHRTEDVRVDLSPVQIADMEEIGTRDPAEMRHVQATREQVAIDIGKGIGPSGHPEIGR